MLLLRRYLVRDGVFYGLCFDTDYPSALQARMEHTWSAKWHHIRRGQGSSISRAACPNPSDLNAFGSLDLTKHLCRELREETGIDIDELDAEPTWILVRDRSYVARRLLSPSLSAREISGLGWVSIIFSFPSSKFAHAIMKAKWGFACVKNVGHCQMYVLANMPSLHGD